MQNLNAVIQHKLWVAAFLFVALLATSCHYRVNNSDTEATMYGDKQDKNQRLLKMVELIAQATHGITQAALARALGVTRSAINKDLGVLHEQGVLLAEDEQGKLSLSE